MPVTRTNKRRRTTSLNAGRRSKGLVMDEAQQCLAEALALLGGIVFCPSKRWGAITRKPYTTPCILGTSDDGVEAFVVDRRDVTRLPK